MNNKFLFQRIVSVFCDVAFAIIFSLVFAKLIVSPILNPITHLSDHISMYQSLTKEFDALQDQYGLYIYDEKENRIENKNVSEEQKENFLNDARVIEIKEEVPPLQNEIRKDTLIEIATSFYVSVAFSYFVVPFVFRKKKATVGKKIFHFVQMKADNLLTNSQYLFKNFLLFLFHYVLGLLSFGIILLLELIFVCVSKDHQTLVDKITKSQLQYDPDYLLESLETDERKQEAINLSTTTKK